eukprot:TRINITY_DN2968_c0_g1_i1.p1 TRINITY_DN2968_c0_g1~~TRINITY_DN2968_c0_g1_i1.p1  ORF type:complete len:1378 (+),score=406.85 TRINITY_DN2968_c0_g1_i1:427-4134(+)
MSDVAFLYPITPSSPMGEIADEWAGKHQVNIFGEVPEVRVMQHEGGAAGALHGGLAVGALCTTFTASQGLLLMLPNMFKLAGELLPTVFHVSARHISLQALSIFGDHSDVMAARGTGYALLSSGSVQEVMDLGCVSHLATLNSSVPFLHYFEGFRISHETTTIQKILPSEFKKIFPYDKLKEYRMRANLPEHPVLLGHSQGPDACFQTTEAANKFYLNTPAIVQKAMDTVASVTGRQYHLFDYYGHPEAERVLVVMGAAHAVAKETIDFLNKTKGEKVGMVIVRLFRPWSEKDFIAALPKTVKRVTVLDRTKEPGSSAEPLFLDVVFSLQQNNIAAQCYGGRFGLASKEFNPSHAWAVFENLKQSKPKNHFTVGINDDVTFTSLPKAGSVPDPEGPEADMKQCIIYGMGSDGTVGSNKSAMKIATDHSGLFSQAYFSYSADKSNALTRSYLRFSKQQISKPYLVNAADYVAVHSGSFVKRFPVGKGMKKGGVFVLNSSWDTVEKLDKALPNSLKKTLAEQGVRLYVVDADAIATQAGIPGKINIAMQAVFFKLTHIIGDEKTFVPILKETAKKEYLKYGNDVIAANSKCIDLAVTHIKQITVPKEWASLKPEGPPEYLKNAPEYIRELIQPTLRTEGNEIPVSKFQKYCLGGISRHNVAQWEKKELAVELPIWDPKECTQCNMCAFSCPHSAIRPYMITPTQVNSYLSQCKKEKRDQAFKTTPFEQHQFSLSTSRVLRDLLFRIQVNPEGCTGCGMCVDFCEQNALKLKPVAQVREREMGNWSFCQTVPSISKQTERERFSVRGSMFQPFLFEYPGSCAGCTETMLFRNIIQLFGARMTIANSSGCSSVWSCAFPRAPYSTLDDGRGVAYGRSLFEDTAEYGYGMAVGTSYRRHQLYLRVVSLLQKQENNRTITPELYSLLKEWSQNYLNGDRTLALHKDILGELKRNDTNEDIKKLIGSADFNANSDLWVKKSHWITGGDGWAYDIGFSGLDQVMASGQDVNILVMDNEVYANTGGQQSKATPRGSRAKFAFAGKETGKKDLGAMMMMYDSVFVCSVAFNSPKNMKLALKLIIEAESFPGPSLILAYSNCDAHKIKGGMGKGGATAQDLAVLSGYWPVFSWDPRRRNNGKNPFELYSEYPRLDLLPQFLMAQGRYSSLPILFPGEEKQKWKQLQEDITRRWKYYEMLLEGNDPAQAMKMTGEGEATIQARPVTVRKSEQLKKKASAAAAQPKKN